MSTDAPDTPAATTIPVPPENLAASRDEGPRDAAPVSPSRLALQSFLRHRLAVLGLILIVGMSLLVVVGPIFWPHDASLIRPWLHELPPRAIVPDGLSLNRLELGHMVSGPPSWLPRHGAGAGATNRLTVSHRVSRSDDIRLVVRRGRLSIMRETGAVYLDELDLTRREPPPADVEPSVDVPDAPAPTSVTGGPTDPVVPPATPGVQSAQILLPDGTLGRSLIGLRLTRDQVPPPDLFPPDGEKVLYIHVVYDATTSVVTAITDAGGKVNDLLVDGVPATTPQEIRGDDLQRVELNGQPCQLRFLLGTDELGRDLAARIMSGGRISLMVGLVATLVSLFIGVLYGALSGYVGGRSDRLMMALVDVLYAIPFMFVVIILLVMFGRDLIILFVALGAVQWLTMARIVRGQVLSLKQQEFIEAARLSGCRWPTLILRHLIPHTIGPVVVYTSLTVPTVILEESFLSFIGLSVQWRGENLASWGLLVHDGIRALGDGGERWWLLVAPALALGAALFGLNAVGDGLRDAFDPKHAKL